LPRNTLPAVQKHPNGRIVKPPGGNVNHPVNWNNRHQLILYMHVAGHGDPEKMAASLRAALSSESKTPFDPPATTAMQVTTALGGANAINFQPTGGGKAAITGDFLVTGNEVNPLIRALRAGDIEVTAIHSHMLDEQPRMFFIHFWANDDAMKLAKGVRAALDKTAVAQR
jgi:hypothetical protein